MTPEPAPPTSVVEPSTTLPAVTSKGPKVPVAFGLMPASIDEAWRLACIVAKAQMVPKDYREHPEDVMLAMLFGAEVGLTPAQAVAGIAVVNGRPGLYGDALLAVVVSSPLYEKHEEYFDVGGERREELTSADLKALTTAAVCTFWRVGDDEPTTRRFSVEDAQRAHLTGKAGPWSEYPQRMLRFRARGYAARDKFPDVLRGIRSAEELADIAPPVLVSPVVHRRSEPPAPPPPAEATTLEPARIVSMRQGLGSDTIVTLSSGVLVVSELAADSAVLEKLIGSEQLVRLTVTRAANDELVLRSFSLQ